MSKVIDRKIDSFSRYLQQRNNLDHIEFLKVRLGMQVAVSNFFKTIVTYGLSILFNVFLYTLITHLSYFLIRRYAHGAHAKSSLMCHVQNILFFIILPWLVVIGNIPNLILYFLSILGLAILIKYAPAATKKQPVPKRLRKGKKIKTILITLILIIVSIFIIEPFQQLILLGILLISVTQLPVFFSKEDV